MNAEERKALIEVLSQEFDTEAQAAEAVYKAVVQIQRKKPSYYIASDIAGVRVGHGPYWDRNELKAAVKQAAMLGEVSTGTMRPAEFWNTTWLPENDENRIPIKECPDCGHLRAAHCPVPTVPGNATRGSTKRSRPAGCPVKGCECRVMYPGKWETKTPR